MVDLLVPPRMLTKTEAAVYAAAGSLARFDRWRRSGMMPDRVPGTTLFDRKAIDAALDALSGISPAPAQSEGSPSSTQEVESFSSLAEWRRVRDERRLAKAAEGSALL